MALGNKIESHKFWDIVTLWAKERLEHETLGTCLLSSRNQGWLVT